MLKIFSSYLMGQHITQGVLPVVGFNNRKETKAHVGGFWVFLYTYYSLWCVLASSSPLHIMSFSFMREELRSLNTVLRVLHIRNFFYSLPSKSKQIWILLASYS
jgi:hypothetical protein